MEVTANPLYMWLVGIALFAGILCAYCLQRKRRREQFYRMADEIGFKSSPNIYSLPADYRCDRRDFPLDYYGKLFNGIQSMVLYGTVNNADVLMFDYADYEEATQTVACFHVDRELVWASFPDKPDSVQGWALRYGAHGWLCLYKPGRRLKPGQTREFLNEAKRIVLPPLTSPLTEDAESHAYDTWVKESLAKELSGRDDLLPPWQKHPKIPRYSIGWRMGEGELYMLMWNDWAKNIGQRQLIEYFRKYVPLPAEWLDWVAYRFGHEGIFQDMISGTGEFLGIHWLEKHGLANFAQFRAWYEENWHRPP